jgi:hypothetical protein
LKEARRRRYPCEWEKRSAATTEDGCRLPGALTVYDRELAQVSMALKTKELELVRVGGIGTSMKRDRCEQRWRRRQWD